MNWKRLSKKEIKNKVFEALNGNINYREKAILGVPASFLDEEQFYSDAPFLKDSPFLSSMIANPNHIGCHTLGDSEPFFEGTQQLEVDVINICAEEIFKAQKNSCDGYVASGGTEANIQAIWIYRNYFKREFNAKNNEIAVVYSEDSHYSMSKAANLLELESITLKVNEEDRSIDISNFQKSISKAIEMGKKYFITVANMSTTMFGSVDNLNVITDFYTKKNIEFKLHIDGAYGGFIYPFTNPNSNYTFENPHITSFTLDGHKMLQSPYGTGIFIIRKGYIDYVKNNDAQYVSGLDFTLCGSRSGANAVSIWMILMSYGFDGWKQKMEQLNHTTNDICDELSDLGISYFRNPYINIITIKADNIPNAIANKYHLVPDTNHSNPKWFKMVIMPHVKKGMIDSFLSELKTEKTLQL